MNDISHFRLIAYVIGFERVLPLPSALFEVSFPVPSPAPLRVWPRLPRWL